MGTEYQELDLKELFKSIKQHWWIVVLATIIGIGISYSVSVYFVTPLYQADTTLFIGSEENTLGISLSDLNRNNQLIEDYRNLAETRLIIESVTEAVRHNVTVKEFRKRMGITVIEDSRLFVVSYRNENPMVATTVANELGKQLSIVVLEIVGVKNIRIIDPAIIPDEPVEPNMVRNMGFGGLSGLAIGLLISFVLFVKDDKVVDKMMVETLVGAPIIGSIPIYDEKADWVASNKLYVKHIPNHFISERYKMFRSNISYLSRQKKSKVFMFTSCSTGEGKTTTITNLAFSLANEGKKVLLIDGDLRRPSVHRRFSLRQNPGLTNLLLSTLDFQKTVKHIDGVDNLDVLTSGSIPPSPDLLLGSEAFATLINQVREIYDFVLIDSTPTLVVSDAIVLSRTVDDVIFVVAMEETLKSDIVNAVRSLKGIGIDLAGVVTTKEKQLSKEKYYGGYE